MKRLPGLVYWPTKSWQQIQIPFLSSTQYSFGWRFAKVIFINTKCSCQLGVKLDRLCKKRIKTNIDFNTYTVFSVLSRLFPSQYLTSDVDQSPGLSLTGIRTWISNIDYSSPSWLQRQFSWTTIEVRASWWRHQMETFSRLLALCAGHSSVTGEFPSQRPVTRSFNVFFDLCLNKWLSKQSWGWWFETPPRSLWRYCNAAATLLCSLLQTDDDQFGFESSLLHETVSSCIKR